MRNCASAVLSLLAVLILILRTQGSVVNQPEINGANSALMYLARFGYINPSATNPLSGSLMSMETVSGAIKDFQSFAGLNQTGTLDEETVKMMNTPRCGVVDKVGYSSSSRRKRYALQGSRWKVKKLAYRITKYPALLTRSEVDSNIERAFQVWADITDLSFSASSSGKIHIEIRFEKAEHGDGFPFDGPGGTLAHAFFPIFGGDAHFDNSEKWTVRSHRGVNLFQLAAHEFGHSLGLSHSDVVSALMNPFYLGYQPRFALDEDDVTSIQSLYGKKETKRKRPPPKKPTYPTKPVYSGAPVSPLCKDGSIDAIVSMGDMTTYAFKGDYYYKLVKEGIACGYPKKISKDFFGVPSKLDAVFTWNYGKTYFFKGSKYWRSSGFTMDEGYPKFISKGFAGIPNNVDAAFVWSGDNKIYFFKGTNYYQFDPAKRPRVAEIYPKDTALWEGIPYYIDDAVQYSNGYTYFFKKGNYWRFNDRTFKVDTAYPPFPRNVGQYWFGCSSKESQTDSYNTTISHGGPKPVDEDVVYDFSFNAVGAQSNDYDSFSNDILPLARFSKDSVLTDFSRGERTTSFQNTFTLSLFFIHVFLLSLHLKLLQYL